MQNDLSASKARLNFFKLILLLAGIAVALYLALNRVKFQNKAAVPNPATLAFSPSTSTVAVGSTFSPQILLNTANGNVRGVDVQITFDRTKLRLTGITPNAASLTTLKTFAPITTTNTFDTAKVINNANASGTIEFGAVTADLNAVSPITAAFNGSTVLATLTFQGLVSGTTAVSFIPSVVPATNLTTDTNIVTDANPPVDTLSGVTNLNVTISGGTTTTPTPGPSNCYNMDFGGTLKQIDISDVQLVAARWNTAYAPYNFNHSTDGLVDIADVQNIASKWGVTCP